MAQRCELRSLSNGTGDRTDKIRTYNFPQVVFCFCVLTLLLIAPSIYCFTSCFQDRVTDHRIGLSINGVDRLMAGETFSILTEALTVYDEKEKLIQFLERINSAN